RKSRARSVTAGARGAIEICSHSQARELMKLLEAPASFNRESALELMRLADDSDLEIREYPFLGRLFPLRDERGVS
ncbi:MAG TPA: hypothetical protein VGU90_11705, partial [Terriglobales bacterium]|nr:hypothetical protein [Terriglobales bacterium]